MPKRPDYTLRIELKNIEDFSPDAVTHSPRTFRPADVGAACANIKIEGSSPTLIRSLAQFLAVEFFALAHGTGLYNRQLKLWTGLAKIATVEVYFDHKGIFTKEVLPSFKLLARDKKGRLITLLRYVCPVAGSTINYMEQLKLLLKSTSQEHQAMLGLFFACPAPFPPEVLEYTRKETNAADALARFESVHPKLGIPINLVEVDANTTSLPDGQKIAEVRLVHPDVQRGTAK